MTYMMSRILRDHPTPKSFWSYHSDTPTPRVEDLPKGVFKGTQDDWETLSPGMRREIARQANRRMLCQNV